MVAIYCTLVELANLSRIVEYATREQAQQAVNTLSNQNLMGRLVYVREVRIESLSRVLCVRIDSSDWARSKCRTNGSSSARIVKLNPVSLVQRQREEVTTRAHHEVATAAVTERVHPAVVVAAKFLS